MTSKVPKASESSKVQEHIKRNDEGHTFLFTNYIPKNLIKGEKKILLKDYVLHVNSQQKAVLFHKVSSNFDLTF